jgi:hypothetical protein
VDALTGAQAHGGTTADGPYAQTYRYDVWGNTTSFVHREWTGSPVTDNTPTTNNRRSSFSYNALGQVTIASDASHVYDAAAARTQLASLGSEYINGNYQPYYQASTSFSGDKRPAKQVTTTIISETATATETRYYLSSTVLGGKPVTELDGSGTWVKTHVYAEGMEVADASPGSTSSDPLRLGWHHTDPVTGHGAWSGRVAETGGSSQLDPLGNDVTSPPPDPIIFPEPRYVDPANSWPLEIAWGPSEFFLEAMADYVGRVNANYDRDRAEYFWSHGRRDLAIDIVSQNPNVGIDYRISGFGLSEPRSGTIFGGEAAGLLTGIDLALRSGALVGSGAAYTRYMVAGWKQSKLTSGQCAGIRELLRREQEHGTFKASKMSSIEFGGPTRLMSLQNEINGIVWTFEGYPLDIDWLLDLNATNPNAGNGPLGTQLGIKAITYTAGKTIWTITKAFNKQEMQNPIPWTEAAERNAVWYAEMNVKYSGIFTPGWLKKNCASPTEGGGVVR